VASGPSILLPFSLDILSSSLLSSPPSSLDSYLSNFNSTLSVLLNKHAPLKTDSYFPKPHKPFITKEIRDQKSTRSKLETLYRRTRLPADLKNFKDQSRLVAKLITSSRRSYFKSLVSSLAQQPKKLWSTLDSLLARHTPPSLPNQTSASTLASSFLNFFQDKITKLSSTFPHTHDFHPDILKILLLLLSLLSLLVPQMKSRPPYSNLQMPHAPL